MTNTILVDGTDLQTTARIMKQWEGVHDTAPQRGQLLTYPGLDGETNVDQPFGPTILGLGLLLRGGSTQVTGFNDQYRTLRRLCKPGRTVTLTKTLNYTGGDESVTATAKLRSMTPSQLTPADYLVAVEFSILSGVWYGSAVTASLSNGSNSVTGQGDTRTHRMTITLTGGTSPNLLNGVGGHSVHFSGSMGSPVVIDVEAGTAMQGATDVSQYLTWSKTQLFRINAGVQTIVLSGGGSASISYSPAFL